eukprot:COSAG02_NODE_44003_length_370_cov_0.280443_1_plen_85_part_01
MRKGGGEEEGALPYFCGGGKGGLSRWVGWGGGGGGEWGGWGGGWVEGVTDFGLGMDEGWVDEVGSRTGSVHAAADTLSRGKYLKL